MKIFIILFCFLTFKLFAAPNCMDKKQILQIDNHAVINYKDFMEKGFKTRALISGVVVAETENRQGHTHLEIDLDEDLTTTDDRVEAIFNNSYGDLPKINGEEKTVICGDYIVDPNSPNKAVIHWLHKSTNTKDHAHGFIQINGQVYGL